MSTRTHALIDHRVQNYQDIHITVMLLAQTVPEAVAVREYWHSVDPESSKTEPELWRPAQYHSADNPDYLGPGGLLASFGPKMLCVSASARWSGFLTIKPLRDALLGAFRSIGKCIHGTRLLLLPDASDVGYHAVSKALSLEQCIARLRQEDGPPQPSVETISPDAFTKPSPGSHMVWFNEAL